MGGKQHEERASLSPISTHDLERPLSAKLFLSVMAGAASVLVAAFAYLLSLGTTINHQLDAMKEDIGQIRPRAESIDEKAAAIDKKVDGWGARFDQRLDRLDDRLDRFASARVGQGTR